MIGYPANPALLAMAMAADEVRAYAIALGLTEDDARDAIRCESARAIARPEPFDWSAVRKDLLDRSDRLTGGD